jgi:hypothetical protein
MVDWYATPRLFCVATESCRAHDAELNAALPATSHTARHFIHADFPPSPRLCVLQLLQNPHCAKLSSFLFSNSSLKQSQSKLPHRKGAFGSLSSSSRFGRKSPDTPWVYLWYAETRRHRCKHTCGLLRLSLPFRNLETVPVAVCTPHMCRWSRRCSLARSPRLQRG